MAQQAQSTPGAATAGNNYPLIRPNQIDALPLNVTAEQKQNYKTALTTLWATLDQAPQGSPAYVEAENKIRTASIRLMQQVRERGGNRPATGGGQAGGGGGAAGATQQQRNQGAGGVPQQQQQQPGGQAAIAQNVQQQGNQQAQQGPRAQQGQQELAREKVYPPHQVIQQGEQAIQNYVLEWRRRAASILQRRDQARARGSVIQNQQKNGQGNPQLQQEISKLYSEMQGAQRQWELLKQQNSQVGVQTGAIQQQAQQQQMNGAPQNHDLSQISAALQGVNAAQQQQQQQQQGDVKMNMDQQQAMSPNQSQGAFHQQQLPQNQAAPAQSTQNLQQGQALGQQTPQSATPSQPQQGFPQQNNVNQQLNQQRPPMNAQQIAQQQQQGTSQPGIPQSATQPQQPGHPQQPQQPQRPQALTHQAAMSQASFARQDAAQQQQSQQPQQQQQQQQPQIPNVPNGIPLNSAVPASATNQTPTSGFPQLPQQASSSTKFPIPKQLTLDPRTQGPVQGPASRPTFSNAGMMGQPGIQRATQFTLEGEGDRVLSKRKLDELVRQVTGSTEGGLLTPEVEEAVLDCADNFVDNVITSACRLAKLRASQTLDVRDIQVVLERNYGIRIPGYGLDEVRTVRKFQPAEGWRSKMQAVQAGKVMGGTGSRDT